MEKKNESVEMKWVSKEEGGGVMGEVEEEEKEEGMGGGES